MNIEGIQAISVLNGWIPPPLRALGLKSNSLDMSNHYFCPKSLGCKPAKKCLLLLRILFFMFEIKKIAFEDFE
jgi:hypothetical protein